MEFAALYEATAAGAGGQEWANLSDEEGAESAALASRAREKVRRCLQARQIVRRLRERAAPEIVAVLARDGSNNHTRGLLLIDWVELMRPDAG